MTGIRNTCLALGVLAMSTSSFAGDHQDQQAMDVLRAMSENLATRDQLVINAFTLDDAYLPEGLVITNTHEIEITIDRPGSMFVDNFDGAEHKHLYFHDGKFTVYRSGEGFYATTEIPEDLDSAMEFALDYYDIEAPLMDLIHRDPMSALLQERAEVIYVGNKARVNGKDCHLVAIRYPIIDLQVWINEGDNPLPQQVMITDKWEGGTPRFVARLDFTLDPKIKQGTFDFTPPEGSRNIGFINQPAGN